MKFVRVVGMMLIAMFMAAPVAHAQEHFKRDLEQVSFIPKGQWITGVSVGYSQSNQNNYQFFVFEKLSGDTYSFKVTPMAMYTFKDNMAGLLHQVDVDAAEQLGVKNAPGEFILDSNTTFGADNLYSIRSNFYATAAFRNYISLGNSSRFGLYNEVQLELGGGQAKFSNYTGDGDNRHLEGTYERNFTMNVGLTPGFVMFLNNYSAIEVSIGVLGFGYTHTRSVTNQVQVAHRNSKHANFKINLFSVQFGMAFYL